jgi:hypothetical protein
LKEIVVPTYAEQRPTPKSIAAYVKSNAATAAQMLDLSNLYVYDSLTV